MKQIKLIIWDLDETFWKGTLSEGPITYEQKHHDVVVELTRRGIANSICSKNTFDDARACLAEHGAWEWFVFPRIDWQPKGQMIASIIEDMQLRPENVLFIDDNHLNLEEARFFCLDLQTARPEIIDKLLSLDACKGKDDAKLSRLNQYKLLEQKAVDQKTASGSNENFLRSCAIVANVGHDCTAHRDRILELINRTNQLNYTRRRLTDAEIDGLLADTTLDAGYVHVSDRYGDYGVCGFYAKRGPGLEHFLFSCRILNMGVENWLYQKLGCPQLEIAGEAVTPLDPGMAIDWIAETNGDASAQAEAAAPASGVSIIVKGGCDLEQIQSYLLKGTRFTAEVDYVSAAGYRITNSHSEILKRCTSETLATYGHVIERIHFFDPTAFTTRFFDSSYGVHIYSVLDDYTRGLYRYRDTDFVVPFGDLTSDLTDSSQWQWHETRSGKHHLDRPFLEWFRANFKFLGSLPPDAFQENITWLCSRLPHDRLLIILNGSEVEYQRNPQGRRWERHRQMNEALEQVAQDFSNVVICDVRAFMKTPQDHSHNIRHYTRQGYFRIAGEINRIIVERCHVQPSLFERLLLLLKFVPNMSFKHILRKLLPAVAGMLAHDKLCALTLMIADL
jgi:FkbH-like protein